MKFYTLLVMTAFLASCAGSKKAAEPTKAAEQKPVTAPAAQASAAQKTETKENLKSFTCKRSADERMIRAEAAQPKGCKLWYSNHSKNDPVAWSANGTEHCLKVGNRIVENLKTAGYDCKEN